MSTRIAFTIANCRTYYKNYASLRSNHDAEEIDKFYDDLIRAIKQNLANYTILCENFNVKIGLKSNPSKVAFGNFRSLDRNERGEMLSNFLLKHDLYHTNSFFQKKEHRR